MFADIMAERVTRIQFVGTRHLFKGHWSFGDGCTPIFLQVPTHPNNTGICNANYVFTIFHAMTSSFATHMTEWLRHFTREEKVFDTGSGTGIIQGDEKNMFLLLKFGSLGVAHPDPRWVRSPPGEQELERMQAKNKAHLGQLEQCTLLY